jgi:GNAT superfamily N-acetyltransferase
MNGTRLTVREVRTPKEERQFLDLPYRLYRDHPYYVPQLRMAQKDILDTRRHPFYKTSDVEKFLAFRDSKVVGRIMAIINRAHNEFHEERTGFFGFFECENDAEVARQLFDAAKDWLRSHGAAVIRGPVNPSTNYECALLVEGFTQSPTMMMPYNFEYYAELIEANGLKKAMDMYAYATGVASFNHSDKLKRVADRLKSRYRIHVRTVNMKEFEREVETVRQIYNDAWSRNWGFVPVSEEEFTHLAKDLKQVVDPSIVFIAEHEEDDGRRRPVAFFLAVPDLNLALKHVKDGRLLPFGLLKLLWHSRKIGFMRIITLGVIKEFQPLGIASVFYDEIYRRAVSGKFKNGEMSWVLESNVMMNRSAELIGGKISKVYRIYEMPLNE